MEFCRGCLIRNNHNSSQSRSGIPWDGFVGEGQGEDVFRFYAFLDKVEDLLGDYSCLTGAGTGKDQFNASTGDGFGLGLGEEIVEVSGLWRDIGRFPGLILIHRD
jgi:hypothetical protein